VRKSVTIDWTFLREGARAKIGSLAAAARSACGLCFAQPVCLTSFALRTSGGWLSPASPSFQSPRSFGSPDLQEEAVKTVLIQAELLVRSGFEKNFRSE